jgi:hypothetical protein
MKKSALQKIEDHEKLCRIMQKQTFEQNSGWIHASYIPFQPRAQYMRAYREDKKTKYKPITGKAVDLV